MRGEKANYCYYSTAREHKIWFQSHYSIPRCISQTTSKYVTQVLKRESKKMSVLVHSTNVVVAARTR